MVTAMQQFGLERPRALAALWWIATAWCSFMLVFAAFVRPVERPIVEFPGFTTPAPAVVAMVVVVVAALVVRRRFAVTSMFTVAACAGIVRALPVVSIGFDMALVVAVFSVTVRETRVRAIRYAIAAAAVSLLPPLALRPESWIDGTIWQVLVTTALANAVGDAVRTGTAQMRDLADRARQAEESKLTEARRQVIEERLRIARDLHDSVAHQIAVINLHAGVAEQSLGRRDDEVANSLGIIGEAARDILREIANLLSVLRSDDADAVGASPGIAEVAQLVSGATRDGLAVTRHDHGSARGLPADVGSTVYQVVREALTNAYKHGSGRRVDLSITWLEAQVEIRARNGYAPSADPTAVAGNGLRGMAERVERIGGRMRVDRGDGEFELVVTLPTDSVRVPS